MVFDAGIRLSLFRLVIVLLLSYRLKLNDIRKCCRFGVMSKIPTFKTFLSEMPKLKPEHLEGAISAEKKIAEQQITVGHCKERETAEKTAKTIIFLGLHKETKIPSSCKSAFDVTCLRMEERLAYSGTEQDMVLLYHEIEVEFPDTKQTENHRATLLEFGTIKNGKSITPMAVTVGVAAAIGALLLLENKIKTRGVLRPLEPEVYEPGLHILQAYGIKLMEKRN
ncbi:hypothetical protein ACFE04_006039 [Oxalis oulophora]